MNITAVNVTGTPVGTQSRTAEGWGGGGGGGGTVVCGGGGGTEISHRSGNNEVGWSTTLGLHKS